MNDVKLKQQIVDKIKNSTNVLVTVSNNPSVDALSAALGLTLMLNKLGKHATAVFSGSIPPAITFLDPEKTFESTIDSLRDFIIALDKEKADHLRYKVDGDVVKIFITPYRTTITSDDLDFSQGDYNVELVIALGVDDQEHLDGALEAHGRILHDATVATISAGDQKSSLGSIDWRDENASSLSEMIVGVTDSLKSDKDKEPLLDSQTATAFLTGIVAATDRFSNTRTSSKVMTIAAQLMGAGADQQLIASKLQESHEIGQPDTQSPTNDGVTLTEDTSSKVDKTLGAADTMDGGMTITHTSGKTLDDIADEVKEKNQLEAVETAEEALEEIQPAAPSVIMPAPVAVTPVITDTHSSYAPPEEPRSGAVNWQPGGEEPLLGGTLNATTEQAADDAKRELESDQNKTILTHSYLGQSPSVATPSYNAPINSDIEPSVAAPVEEFSPGTSTTASSMVIQPSPTFVAPTSERIVTPSGPTLSEIDAQNRDGASRDEALAAVHATFDDGVHQPPAPATPFMPAPGITLPQPPPLPDFSTMPPPPILSAYAPDATVGTPPERLGDIFPDTQAPPPVAQPPNDPGQFQIPGQ